MHAQSINIPCGLTSHYRPPFLCILDYLLWVVRLYSFRRLFGMYENEKIKLFILLLSQVGYF